MNSGIPKFSILLKMNPLDSAIISSIKNCGVYIPDDVISLDMIDRVFFFNLCLNCIGMINCEIFESIQLVGCQDGLSHANCMLLVEEIINLGYSEDLSFFAFLYPELDSIRKILTWFVSLLSNVNDQTSKKSIETGILDSNIIYNSILNWKQTPIVDSTAIPSPSIVKSLLIEEDRQLLSEDMRYTWGTIPFEGLQQGLQNTSFNVISLSKIASKQGVTVESITRLQSDIFKCNQLYYAHKRRISQMEKKALSLERSMRELSNMIKLTEDAVFEKEKENDIISNVEFYLNRIGNNSEIISSKTLQEEMLYMNQKEEINGLINNLEEKRQLYWEQSQSLLVQIQENRQEIEGITAIVGEKKQEKEELSEMIKCLPQQAFRDVYTSRLHTLSSRQNEQQHDIDKMIFQISTINQNIASLYEEVSSTEGKIEQAMRTIFGTRIEGVSLYSHYSQIKRLFSTFITMIYQIAECNDEIARITIRLNQVDVGEVCKNSDLLSSDIKKV